MATYDITTDTIAKLKTGDIINCPYSGSAKSITLPKGIYKLEVWGAQGGSYSSYYGGYGGYSVGTIELIEDTTMYLYAGGQPATNSQSQVVTSGGFNGGGKGANKYYNGTYTYGQGGGGGSDIRIGTDSLYARVIVAGGGSGSNSVNVSTTKYGGGLTGGSPISGYGATQISAGPGGSFGVGANTSSSTAWKSSTGGGGGGWYGGGAYQSNTDTTSYRSYSGGGSGYVYTADTASNYPSGCLLDSSYYLTEASTLAGNTSFIDPESESSTTGRSGHGYVRITVINLGPSLFLECKVKYSYKKANPACKIDGSWKSISDGYIKKDNIWLPLIKEE